MPKTATLSMRLDPTIKSQAENIYSTYGISLSEAIDIFLHKTILDGGLPFDLRQPRYNKETEDAILETQQIISGKIKGAERFPDPKSAIKSLIED